MPWPCWLQGAPTPLLVTPIFSRPVKIKKRNNEAEAQRKKIQERKKKQVLLKPQHSARKTRREGKKAGRLGRKKDIKKETENTATLSI